MYPSDVFSLYRAQCGWVVFPCDIVLIVSLGLWCVPFWYCFSVQGTVWLGCVPLWHCLSVSRVMVCTLLILFLSTRHSVGLGCVPLWHCFSVWSSGELCVPLWHCFSVWSPGTCVCPCDIVLVWLYVILLIILLSMCSVSVCNFAPNFTFYVFSFCGYYSRDNRFVMLGFSGLVRSLRKNLPSHQPMQVNTSQIPSSWRGRSSSRDLIQ